MRTSVLTITFVICFVVIALLLPQAELYGQEGKKTSIDEVHLKDYDIYFYGRTMWRTPHAVMYPNEYGDIILASIGGKTFDQLKEMGATRERIRVLQTWGVLIEEDCIYKPGFPLIYPEKTRVMRDITKKTAMKIGKKVKKEVEELVKKIKAEGWKENAYTIIFSYVLDDLPWDLFDEVERACNKEFTLENPINPGFLWAVYPKRKFSCGTNGSSSGGISFKFNHWNEIEKLTSKMQHNEPAVEILFKKLQEGQKLEDKETIETLVSYNICDSDGNPIVPFIKEEADDSLYPTCKLIADKVVQLVRDELDFKSLEKLLGVKEKGELILISYHEIMWDFMDYIEGEGIVQKPKIFADLEHAELKDVADVMMIVKEKEGK